ncbi:hypothetical protein KPL33_08330 [Clostridium algidicarnis]|uniref:hypothetical protein n=1 Tax=Clostridium algidicarnis TaxID=37659 RepID=UPI001C0E6506|nr:hypothetical protein [Clostridium algidicarnis]MBU3206984.1 hypothetical protein [Clostridium algidicarnis]
MGFDEMKQGLWPQKGEKLVKETDNYYNFAHFGWGNVETQFYGYMEGYKEAADNLIEYATNSKDIKTLDTFIFPICFLYRQYLELAMKNIFLKYSGSSEEDKVKVIKNVSHNLNEMWKKMVLIISEETTNEEKEDIKIVRDYIKQFSDFDKSSFTFRYPINKELDLLFKEEKFLDLINLRERMNELYNFFEGCDGKLDSIRDFKYEMMSNYLSDMDY